MEFVWSDAVHGVFKIPDGTCPDSFAVGGDMVLVSYGATVSIQFFRLPLLRAVGLPCRNNANGCT